MEDPLYKISNVAPIFHHLEFVEKQLTSLHEKISKCPPGSKREVEYVLLKEDFISLLTYLEQSQLVAENLIEHFARLYELNQDDVS